MEAELSRKALEVLQQERFGLTSVVATTDEDGRPHTAPFGSVRALDARRLRFGCGRNHGTYANLRRDPRVTVCVLAPPDVAVSISGRARVVKERMDTLADDVVIEIEVEGVKNDMLTGPVSIESGATYSAKGDMVELLRAYVDEVEGA
jgi:uncharacterized pyridoxamine 5'-phosphate oxidase family protein